MNRTKPTESTRDERGVSETLGVILMFGLLVAALTIVQVNAVPTQNAKVEYQHDQDARTDFQEVRTAIIETAGADEPRSASVDLGVTYPGRLLFINPGPVNGQLETVEAGEYLITESETEIIDIQQICGIDDTDATGVKTNALAYGIDYHVYSGDADHVYENTVVHQRSGTNGADVIHNDQQIIRGSTIALYPLVGDVQYSGTAGQSIDFVSAGTSTVTKEFDNEWTFTIPSALDWETWGDSDQLLKPELEKAEPTVLGVSDGGNGHVDVRMKDGTYNFKCTMIGVNETPENVTPVDDTDDDSDADNEINPVVDDALTYVDAQVNSDDTVTVTWRNDGTKDIRLSAARIPFYNADSQGNAGGGAATDATFDGLDIRVGGPYGDLPADTAYVVDANGGTIQVTVTFMCGASDTYVPGIGDYFAVALETEVSGTADRHNYFVTPVGGKSGNFNRCSNAGPTAAFVVTPSDPVVGQTVTFDASSSTTSGSPTYAWDFDGDGTTDATGQSVTHAYTAVGDYDVELTVSDNKGDDTITSTVSVGTASLTASLSISKSGNEYTFDATGSTGAIVEYRWDFNNDGTIDDTTTAGTATRTYTGNSNPSVAAVEVYDGTDTDTTTATYP